MRAQPLYLFMQKMIWKHTNSRRSYTAVFKLQVVEYAEQNVGNLAAQREFGVSEKKPNNYKSTTREERQVQKNNYRKISIKSGFYPFEHLNKF